MISGIDGASRMSSVFGLKVRPSTAMVLPRRLPPSARRHLARHRPLARVVHRQHRLDDPQRHVVVLRGLDQRARVLRKARAAEARTRMQEFCADAVVEADAARNLLHVGADALGKVGDLVDEGDLGREERIGCILDQFGGAARRCT